jgi:hypothetical protein
MKLHETRVIFKMTGADRERRSSGPRRPLLPPEIL